MLSWQGWRTRISSVKARAAASPFQSSSGDQDRGQYGLDLGAHELGIRVAKRSETMRKLN